MPTNTNTNNKNTKPISIEQRQTRSSSASRLLDRHKIVDTKSSSSTKKCKTSESSPTKLPVAKKPTHMNMTTATLDDLKQLLQQQTQTIKNDIQLEIKAMSDDLKASFHIELTKLNERVDAIESSVSSQISHLKVDIDSCVNRLNGTDDDFARIAKLNELKISGIAHANNENLIETFGAIAKVIGYDIANTSNVPDLVRMQKRNQHSTDFVPLPHIIVKFVAPHIRNKFYGLYLAKATKEPIRTEHLNLPQGGIVRIGELLTPHNQSIFTEAIKLKRDKTLLKVNTVDGLVRVKAVQSERFVTIKSKRELDLYVATKSSTSSASSSLPPTTHNTDSSNGSTGTPSESTTTKSTTAAPVQSQPAANQTNNQLPQQMEH